MRRKINLTIAVLCLAIAVLLCSRMGISLGWPWAVIAMAFGVLHLLLPTVPKKRQSGNSFLASAAAAQPPEGSPTELVLLSEEGSTLAVWELYGKNGLVIGRDVGENHVTVNLDHTTYASMIDVEHAVLNYSGNDWYVEDISSRNGVSVQKSDGRKYKISYGKPCKLEQGDIIFIGLTRLQII